MAAAAALISCFGSILPYPQQHPQSISTHQAMFEEEGCRQFPQSGGGGVRRERKRFSAFQTRVFSSFKASAVSSAPSKLDGCCHTESIPVLSQDGGVLPAFCACGLRVRNSQDQPQLKHEGCKAGMRKALIDWHPMDTSHFFPKVLANGSCRNPWCLWLMLTSCLAALQVSSAETHAQSQPSSPEQRSQGLLKLSVEGRTILLSSEGTEAWQRRRSCRDPCAGPLLWIKRAAEL